jgi:putative phage-type endonuclease
MNANTLELLPSIGNPGFLCGCEVFNSRLAWLEARRLRIQASDTAAIFGVGYADQSPVTIWESKVNPVADDDRGEARYLKIGKLMEPALRAIFSDETGMPCVPTGEFTIYTHPYISWLGATLDAATLHDEYGLCPVELKNVSNFNRDEWQDDEHPPLKFAVQVQHQLAVTGATHGFLLGLVGGNQPVVKVIERDERFIDAMLKRLEEFWGYVQRNELPPVDESIATSRALARIFRKPEDSEVVLPDDAILWSGELEQAKETIKKAEAVKTAAENKLKAAIGNATYGVIPGGFSYSWKEQTRKEHVVAESTFRVLRKCK